MKKSLIYLFISIALFSACNPSAQVKKRGGYILVKNTVKADNSYLVQDELNGFVQQSAMQGRFVPFFRPGVWFWEMSMKGKETGFKRFIRKAFGTKPIILDTTLIQRSVIDLNAYVQNKGFYHSNITHKILYASKTAKVEYLIKAGEPCIVEQFSFNIPDSAMRKYIFSDTLRGKLHTGMIYDTYVLGDERTRIAANLRNVGYYNFSQSDIYYLADTFNYKQSATVELMVKKLRVKKGESADSIVEITHPQYYLKNIYILPENELLKQPAPILDTLVYKYRIKKSDTSIYTIHLLYNRRPWLKPNFFSSKLLMATGNLYSQKSANNTYKNLIAQPIIRSASINMVPRADNTMVENEKQWLDTYIKLNRNIRNTLSVGTEGTNSAGRLGMGLITTIQNRNLFRGAEVLSLKIRTSAEVQANFGKNQTTTLFKTFNTLEGGIEGSIDFPRILFPYKELYMQTVRQARTSVSAGYGFEFRPDFRRLISTAAWSYFFESGERSKHIVTPLELNYVKISNISQSFANYLDSLSDPRFKSRYSNHLLTVIRYSFTNDNLTSLNKKGQYFIRTSIETSGNMLNLIDRISKRPKTMEGYYKYFGVRYSQYVRWDADFRRYWAFSKKNILAFRFMTGLSIPYGNSIAVPFEKSFWLGGANDMRGWKLRSLGPGAYVSPNLRFDQTGNILLQSSIEHRFPIYNFVLGSLFADAGNVWLLKPSNDFPNGNFNIRTFGKQIAMDAGFGLRFDFSFFVFRLDLATPIYNPALTNKWFNPSEFKFKYANWNVGIGYPF